MSHRKWLLAIILFIPLYWWWSPIRMFVWPMDGDCRYTFDQRYEVYTDKWRTIPLCGLDKTGIYLSGGVATDIEDVNIDYIKKEKLKKWHRVNNGNYVVMQSNSIYTVWSPELMTRWKAEHP